MTPKQTEKLKGKIAEVKRILAAEKRKFGCYDDSRGLRYLPAGHYIRLGDYAGGLAYLKWFYRNFPDDGGLPEFLFESAILFFKAGRRKEAGNAVFQTFCSNPYWIDRFFDRRLTRLDIWHSSNLTTPEYTAALAYSGKDPELADFSAWLNEVVLSEDFTHRSGRYIAIYCRLNAETDKEVRGMLIQEAFQLEAGVVR
jgi:hypothetical protein